jgi:N-acetylglucosaminyldiphosphoundecaprenol N-acetyl-beta-D-mannosaminyltransferase
MSELMNPSLRFNYFGVNINATNPVETVSFLLDYDYSNPNYILFPDSSVVATAQQDTTLTKILNDSLLTLPDGLPSALYARSKGFKKVDTVSGYRLCNGLLYSTKTHYFLGGSAEILDKIKENIRYKFPEAKILGFTVLPFYEMEQVRHELVLKDEIDKINHLKPDLIWVGISSPKQDYLLSNHVKILTHGLLLGVGGVFDYLAETQKKSPEWVKKIGLRWLWRLAKEPKRLGPKYLAVARFYLSKAFKH